MTSPLGEDAPLVVLLRSPDAEGEDRYVRALVERGFRAVCRPVLRFGVAGDPSFAGGDVEARLRRPDDYAGLVLTSPRAAQALTEALGQPSAQRAAWENKLAFAVGPKTAKALRKNGLTPKGAESGDAETLASVIAREASALEEPVATRALLFCCGNRRREALPRRLRREGVAFEECVVYETHLRGGPWLADAPGWAVFFSPSGVEAVERSSEVGWDAVRKAALGPTTAGALRDAGWPPDAVARAPTPQALVEAITRGQSA